MFKKGSIRKVEVKNFVTYSYIEFYPGPNLNMIIGPNGSGKSTIVAAIILGLGGNPKVVGRGTKVSEYIKHRCNEAVISIHLQNDDENDFIKITRRFTKDDKSNWTINNQNKTVKEVINFIKEYNIQVDNLCQFLPQDKVQDFAKLNKQELLIETQKALCRDDLIEKQQLLIETRERQKKLVTLTEKSKQQLQQALDANARLESKVENFNKRQKYLTNIQHIDRKIAWVQYEELYEKMNTTKEDLNEANKIYEKYKNQLKPLEDEMNQLKKFIENLQQNNSNLAKIIQECSTSIRSHFSKFDEFKQSIRDINEDMETKIYELSQKQTQIGIIRQNIEELKQSYNNLVSQNGNVDEIKNRSKRLHDEMKKYQSEKSIIMDKKDETISNRQNYETQIKILESELRRLENVKQKRLENLRRIDEDAYRGVLWLRKNKHLFKGEVYEPIILELNMLNAQKAVYVENIIPVRDRVAFTCVLKEDMHLLLHSLRDEQKLKINVLHSARKNDNFHPAIPIEQLRRYGFNAYLSSLFTVPDPILSYLCTMYRVHEIPVGNQTVEQMFGQVPNNIKVFFSENKRYAVTISRITGEKSIRQNVIHANGDFSVVIDLHRLESYKGQISDNKDAVNNCNNQIGKLDAQLISVEEKLNSFQNELKNIQTVEQQLLVFENRINIHQRKIDQMNKDVKNPDDIKSDAKRKIEKCMTSMGELQDKIKLQYIKSLEPKAQQDFNKIKIDIIRKKTAYIKNQIDEIRLQSQEAENNVKTIKDVYSHVRAQAKVALQKAKDLSNNFTPDDEGFNEFREIHEQLSTDLRVLMDKKKQIQYKVDILVAADDGEMQEYEKRQQDITTMQSEINRADVEHSKIESKIKKIKDAWLTPLKQLVGEINQRFAVAFERMNCEGQVEIYSENEMEYSEYGLAIKVSYRRGEPLQELNRAVQSGGERAVATAAFMLSLQELTPVPFRCVDEINQGMDANNERRIFDLLVECTSQINTSQYFLITPKLVPNLRYSPSVMVHIVHNGPFVEPDRKWTASKLCNPQGIQLH